MKTDLIAALFVFNRANQNAGGDAKSTVKPARGPGEKCRTSFVADKLKCRLNVAIARPAGRRYSDWSVVFVGSGVCRRDRRYSSSKRCMMSEKVQLGSSDGSDFIFSSNS